MAPNKNHYLIPIKLDIVAKAKSCNEKNGRRNLYIVQN